MISIGKEYGGQAEITNGLKEGDVLIVAGYDVVNDGSGVIPSTSSGTSFEFRGWKSDVWSMQGGIAAHVMGGGSHLPLTVGALSRWGFITNNEGNWQSIDVFGGIGMSYSWSGYVVNSSAGDYIGCCQNTTGLNRTMRVQMFGR